MSSVEERFWAKVDKTHESGCWLWTAGTDKDDYGQFSFEGRTQKAHRVLYILTHGDIPEGMHVLHDCDIPGCVNPEHLHLGTHQDNMRERDVRGRLASQVGVNNSKAKLSEDEVLAIRTFQNYYTRKALADMFGVGSVAISDIVLEKNWRHIA